MLVHPGMKELARTLTLQMKAGSLICPHFNRRKELRNHTDLACADLARPSVLNLRFLSLKSGEYRIYHRAQRKWSPVYKMTVPALLLSPIELPLLWMCAQMVIMTSNSILPFSCGWWLLYDEVSHHSRSPEPIHSEIHISTPDVWCMKQEGRPDERILQLGCITEMKESFV